MSFTDKCLIRKVAIVGGGPAGVAAAKYLLAEAFLETIDIYEQQSSPGGVWNYVSYDAEEQIPAPQIDAHQDLTWPLSTGARFVGSRGSPIFPTPMYDGLETNIPHYLMQHSESYSLQKYQLFPKRETVLEYLKQYASDVRHLVKFRTQITDVRLRSEDEHDIWTVEGQDLISHTRIKQEYDAIVVANGHYDIISIPNIPGIRGWNLHNPGLISHSKFFRNAASFKDKKVLVVGFSASGLDITWQIGATARLPILVSQRSTTSTEYPIPIKMDVPEIAGFLSPSLRPRAVRFVDGRVEEDIDAVLFCTGYFYSLPFLSSLKPPLVSSGDRVERLYKHLFSIDHPTLAFVGLPSKIIPFHRHMQSEVSLRPFTKHEPRHGRQVDPEIEAEQRLLGTKRNDAQAVPIQKPRSSREVVRMPNVSKAAGSEMLAAHCGLKMPVGGPRPRNTLDTNNSLPNVRKARDSAHNTLFSKPNQLPTQYFRGSNIGRQLSAESSSCSHQPTAKRRKIERVANSASPVSDVSVEDPMKGQPPDDLIIIAKSPSMSRTPSGSGQQLAQRQLNGTFGGVNEYRAVEETMNSTKIKRRKQRRRSNKSHSSGIELSGSSSPHSGVQTSIGQINGQVDFTGGEDELSDAVPGDKTDHLSMSSPKPTVLQRQHNDMQQHDLQNGTETSKYFSTEVSKRLRRSPEKPKLTSNTPTRDLRLNSIFVGINGKNRGLQSSTASPDELASGTTVGRRADRNIESPTKTMRNAVGTHTNSARLIRLPAKENDIPPAKFQTKRLVKEREAPESFAVGITSINLPGLEDLRSLGLSHHPKEDIYNVIHNGGTLKYSGSGCQVIRSKLQKIVYEMRGKRIRFESSLVGGAKGTLEIQLSRVEDMDPLLKHLERKDSPQVVGKESEWMQKLFSTTYEKTKKFETRILARLKAESSGAAALQVDELRRHNIQKRKLGRERITSTVKPNIVDGLVSSKSSEIAQLSKERLSKETSSKPQRKTTSGVDGVLKNLKPGFFNDKETPRRSTRSSNDALKSDDIEADKANLPEPPKYSKIHGLGSKWKRPLSYPKIGKKKATVEFQDLERLDEGELLNDSLVTFYLRYLEHDLEQRDPEQAKRIYFFSTYFYERLTNFSTGKREINYAAVEKWTRNVDIFTYDYLIIPVNEAYHWYVAIICNLPALNRRLNLPEGGSFDPQQDEHVNTSPVTSQGSHIVEAKEQQSVANGEGLAERGTRESFAELSLDGEDQQSISQTKNVNSNAEATTEESVELIFESKPETVERSGDVFENKPKSPLSSKKQKRQSLAPIMRTDPTKPLIITFDSFGTPHSRPIGHLKDYLLQEGKTKRGGMEIDAGSIKGITAKGIPEQNNFSDCGIYLLGYLEKFMRGDQQQFISKTIKRQFVDGDWSALVPSQIRNSVRELLLDLGKIQEEEYRNAKGERRKSEDKGHQETAKILEHSMTNEPPVHASGKAISTSIPSKPPFLTRGEALEQAQPLDSALEQNPGKEKLAKSTEIEATEMLDDDQAPIQPHAQFMNQEEASLILLDERPYQEEQSQVLKTQPSLPGGFPTENAELPNLPSQIEDSQEPQQERKTPDATFVPRTPSPILQPQKVKEPHSTPNLETVAENGNVAEPEPKRRRKRYQKEPLDDPPALVKMNTVISIDD
ncbi:uncharacterized protein KY384_005255 [Bacidia gigantensis]|uniref:uncharacterized protein n=1 Tax=Bacidia gigantensis TaxID=2732470 RepID=UPI001D03D4B2|nr:uncharacterized protein KY384_005255 [Bacidia gigantensis]KAG8529774.1 hypothetical protein KY384_005255 [Bacidia gigantensis]